MLQREVKSWNFENHQISRGADSHNIIEQQRNRQDFTRLFIFFWQICFLLAENERDQIDWSKDQFVSSLLAIKICWCWVQTAGEALQPVNLHVYFHFHCIPTRPYITKTQLVDNTITIHMVMLCLWNIWTYAWHFVNIMLTDLIIVLPNIIWTWDRHSCTSE